MKDSVAPQPLVSQYFGVNAEWLLYGLWKLIANKDEKL
jgi:hypothetical protein